MRTNIEFGALSSIEPAEMKAVEGGVAIAFDARATSALSKYADVLSDRFGPTVGPPRDELVERLYP